MSKLPCSNFPPPTGRWGEWTGIPNSGGVLIWVISAMSPSDEPVCEPELSPSLRSVTVALAVIWHGLAGWGSDKRPCVGLGWGGGGIGSSCIPSQKSSSSSLVSPHAFGRRGRPLPLSMSRLAPLNISEEWSGEIGFNGWEAKLGCWVSVTMLQSIRKKRIVSYIECDNLDIV